MSCHELQSRIMDRLSLLLTSTLTGVVIFFFKYDIGRIFFYFSLIYIGWSCHNSLTIHWLQAQRNKKCSGNIPNKRTAYEDSSNQTWFFSNQIWCFYPFTKLNRTGQYMISCKDFLFIRGWPSKGQDHPLTLYIPHGKEGMKWNEMLYVPPLLKCSFQKHRIFCTWKAVFCIW